MNFDKKKRSRVQGGWAASAAGHKASTSSSVATNQWPHNLAPNEDAESNTDPFHCGCSDSETVRPMMRTNNDQKNQAQKFVYDDSATSEDFKRNLGDTSKTNMAVRQLKNKFPSLVEFVGRSQEYIHKFVDSHCHIDLLFNRYGLPKNHSYASFVKDHSDSFPVNYEGCVAIFCDPKTFHPTAPDDVTLKMASSTENVWLALGCHPKNATRFTDDHLPSLRSALLDPKVKALGEIGLDYSGGFDESMETQKKVFSQQISLALELHLPLVIHCRDADTDCLDILKKMVPRDWFIHRHCFTQDLATAQEWLAAFDNMYLGFTPLICRTSASVAKVREAAAETPLNRLLLETDAPYFIPEGVRLVTQGRGVKLSHPGYALFTAESLARLKNVSVDTMLEACRTNTRNLYKV